MKRKGFTLVEMIVVIIVLGILASIGMLKYSDLRNAALAAQMAQEVRAIQYAAFNYFAEHEDWPAEVGPGAVPTGLAPLLPGALAGSLDRGDYMLDYENFGSGGEHDVVIGVSITSNNERLFAKFVHYLGTQSPFFLSGNKLTYLIAGPGGIF